MIHFRSRKAFTVAVEGNIGSGKTTFLNRFCPETDNVDVLAEPVDRDGYYDCDHTAEMKSWSQVSEDPTFFHHELLP